MKYNCDHYINKYLMLDKGERIPSSVTAHMLKCPKCRKEIKTFSNAEKIAAEPIKLPATANMDQIRKIVNEIAPNCEPKKHQVSMGSWIFFGLFLLVAILGFGTIKFGHGMNSKLLSFLFYSSSATALVAYVSVFFACNLDYFVKRLHIKYQ